MPLFQGLALLVLFSTDDLVRRATGNFEYRGDTEALYVAEPLDGKLAFERLIGQAG